MAEINDGVLSEREHEHVHSDNVEALSDNDTILNKKYRVLVRIRGGMEYGNKTYYPQYRSWFFGWRSINPGKCYSRIRFAREAIDLHIMGLCDDTKSDQEIDEIRQYKV